MPGKITSLHNRVMIVDDNEEMLHLYGRLLAQEGFEVLTATTGEDCLKQIESVCPDIFLLDVVLPDWNGIDLVREIKACPEFASSMIILMSAILTDSDIRTTAMEAGALDYLTRPVPFKELLAKLKSFIKVMDFQQSLMTLGNNLDQMVTERTTELENTVKALNRSNEQVNRIALQQMKLFEASPIGIVIVADRIYTSVNNKACEILGYSKEELLGSKTSIIYPSQEAFEQFASAVNPTLLSGKIAVTENVFIRKDGTKIIVKSTGNIIDKSDYSAGTVWFFEDVTAQRHDEAMLRKLSQAVEQSPVSIEITDLAGNIEYINPKFIELTGYSIAELLGRNPSILKSGQTPPANYEKLWDTITAGNIWEGEFCNKRKDGSLYWEQAKISPINDKNGAITNYLAVKEDITEKKDLTEQLIHSQKMESIGQLAGGLAHDLNNILTVINGHAALMALQNEDDSEMLQNIREIHNSVSRASYLTRSLLTYSRKQEIDRKDQCLNRLIETFGKFVSRAIRDNIRFTLSLMNEPLIVSVDTVQLEQVLLNLVMNAQDAMPDGGEISIATSPVIIHVKKSPLLKEQLQAGQYALITFSDTGQGMDEATGHKIFDPFFTTKEVGKGTGLGLSVVMGIIKSHGGFIDLESEPGKGSVFSIHLPLLPAHTPESAAAIRDDRLQRGGGVILLAEDDDLSLLMMKELLTRAGYKVITAIDGADAVDKFKAHKDEIGLVISDVVMPIKSGSEAFQEIKKIDGGMKCIFVSGHDYELIHNTGKDINIELLLKPILPHELLQRVSKAIRPVDTL